MWKTAATAASGLAVLAVVLALAGGLWLFARRSPGS